MDGRIRPVTVTPSETRRFPDDDRSEAACMSESCRRRRTNTHPEEGEFKGILVILRCPIMSAGVVASPQSRTLIKPILSLLWWIFLELHAKL